MPRLAHIIGKPETLQAIDRFSEMRAQVDSAPILRLFRSKRTNLVDIAEKYGLVRSAREAQHLRTHLLNEGKKGWWQHAQPIEPIVRQALLKTVELVRQHDLPVDAYWVCSGSGRNAPVEASVAVSKQQITLIFHTPRPPVANLIPAEKAAIWVVRRTAKGKVVTQSVKARPVK